ncbi:MAG: hypothetical protein U0414_02205 [Polyangiaceae bacterium]
MKRPPGTHLIPSGGGASTPRETLPLGLGSLETAMALSEVRVAATDDEGLAPPPFEQPTAAAPIAPQPTRRAPPMRAWSLRLTTN